MKSKLGFAAMAVALCMMLTAFAWKKKPSIEDQKIEIGRQMFFDKTFSEPNGEACSVCHSPRTRFADPFGAVVSEGIIDNFFVIRNSPSLAYGKFIPPLAKNAADGEWYGGLFWDGRSNSLEHQLSGPFFNRAEMHNPDTLTLANEVLKAPYYKLYKQVYGKSKDPKVIYNNLVDALAHFERSDYLHWFDSKYDFVQRGEATYTDEELAGYALFVGKANCNKCHTMSSDASVPSLFTNFSYHNLGVPRNESNPYYTTDVSINPLGKNAVDEGLGAVVNDEKQRGKFRTPTLRNVELTAPYFHNGVAATLEEAVDHVLEHHYRSEVVPEIGQNVEDKYTGRIQLSTTEKRQLIAFLKTLSDGYEVK